MFNKKYKCAVCEKPLEGKDTDIFVVLDGLSKNHEPIPTCSLECAQKKKSEDITILTKQLSTIMMQELPSISLAEFAKGAIPPVITRGQKKAFAEQAKKTTSHTTIAPTGTKNRPEQTAQTLKNVTLHTYGGCLPGKDSGGWGFILKYGDRTLERSGGEIGKTSAEMELTAVAEGLKQLKVPCNVNIITDSKNVKKTIDVLTAKKEIPNSGAENPIVSDQIKTIYDASKKHLLRVFLIKTTAGESENEKCLQMAIFEAENILAIPKEVPSEE